MKPKYSIIIPTTGCLKTLRRLLDSLTYLDGIRESEILIVLNPASDALDHLKDLYPHLNLQVLTSEPGVNRARNQGQSKATGELILFLDDDCWISNRRLLLEHESLHQKNPWAFAVGGFYQTTSSSLLSNEYDKIQKQWLLSNRLSGNGECLTLLGGHFSIRNQENLPLFDESIAYGGAETEYFFRLKKENYRFLLTDLFVNHEPNLTLFLFLKKAYLQGRTHRRLVNAGLFQTSPWQNANQRSPIQKLYERVFHQNWLSLSWKPLLDLHRKLKSLHHDFWFYLSNRNGF